MGKIPTISILIPIYNAEKYLGRCLDSLQRQIWTDFEIVAVDDGSQDGSVRICEKYAQADHRIRLIRQTNRGVSAARNTCLRESRGEYLTFVDSDDMLEPDALRRAWEAQQACQADLVIFNLVYVDEHNHPLPAPDFSGFRDEVLTADEVWQRYFALAEQKIYYVVAWNKLYRRELFKTLRYAPGKRYEDQFLLPGLLDQCKTVACLRYVGYRYAQRGGSIMAQGSSRNYLDRSEFLLEWCDSFAGKGDFLRAEGLLNDAIANLGEKHRFDLSTPAQRARYRTACRGCAAAYRMLAQCTGQRSMLLRAALLGLGLPVYLAFLHSRQ